MLRISAEVQAALDGRKAVVALETTILSHGMPYPQNLETARAVEQAVRDHGAVPATIAVLDGAICVGLDAAQLERIATGTDALKLSRADLAYALAERRDGATTVAATMLCAQLAGIGVFATGGIGGVHRGAEQSFDVSADLYELARTPLCVVCSGAKALLDIAKTLEVLETLGVPVAAFGADDFPAFWSRESGLRAPLRFDTVAEVVRFVRVQRALNLRSGVLIANPVPTQAEIPAAEMERFIARAVEESRAAQISGKAVTPWLLARIVALSGGRSLETNRALIAANAALAAQLAVAFAAS